MERHEEKQDRPTGSCNRCAEKISRRALVNAGISSIGLGMAPALLLGQTDPASNSVQAGDLLVKTSDKTNKPLQPDDIAIGASPTLVWPMDASKTVVRSQNRFNALLLIRLDSGMTAKTKSMSADGVLAFSALCPHAGCTIDAWVPERSVLECDCHSSEFDPREAGKVVDGPAARPLPPLALKLVDGKLAVARPFAVPIRIDE